MAWLNAFHGLNIILLAFSLVPVGNNDPIYWLIWFAYASLFGGLLARNPWCVRLLLIPPVIIVCTTGPVVAYNLYAFLSRHPLYINSPATIIVATVLALFTTVPSLCLLACYWILRREIFMEQI